MTGILLTAVAFVAVFGLLVMVHELGHFTMAKRAGVKVDEFGFGLPPRIWGIKKGETIYSINWIPFGGFVRLYGEDDMTGKSSKNPRSFMYQSAWTRTKIILAGVSMNFILAIFLLTIGFSVGMQPFPGSQEFDKLIISQGVSVKNVLPDMPADHAMLKGDKILKVAGQDIKEGKQVVTLTQASPNKDLEFVVERDGENKTLIIQPTKNGRIGVEISTSAKLKKLKLSVGRALIYSIKETGRLSFFTIKAFGAFLVTLFSKFAIPKDVAGPIGIIQMTHEALLVGLIPLLKLTALLSISLGVINVIPFPALDGGRFLFIIIEVIRGKPANSKVESMIHAVGFIALLALIFAVTWHDVLRIITQ